ncbi:hypothetical protein [Brochothrix thermosphacta]|uniref:hypothetical protein n=1 Tax=Brochothrix thermosphacta TaxID=2756 RepID=UPI0039AFD4BD
MKFLKVLAIRTGNNKGSDSSFKTKKNWKKPLDDIFTVIGWFLKFLKVLAIRTGNNKGSDSSLKTE